MVEEAFPESWWAGATVFLFILSRAELLEPFSLKRLVSGTSSRPLLRLLSGVSSTMASTFDPSFLSKRSFDAKRLEPGSSYSREILIDELLAWDSSASSTSLISIVISASWVIWSSERVSLDYCFRSAGGYYYSSSFPIRFCDGLPPI